MVALVAAAFACGESDVWNGVTDAHARRARSALRTLEEALRRLAVHAFLVGGRPGVPEFVYQYGFWGSVAGVREDPSTCGLALPTLSGNETLASVEHNCPKYRALLEQVPP